MKHAKGWKFFTVVLSAMLSSGGCVDSPSPLAAPVDVSSANLLPTKSVPTRAAEPPADTASLFTESRTSQSQPQASLQVTRSSHLYASVAEKKAELAKARTTLLQFAANSKRGLEGVRHSLQILDALSAPTELEFRRRMDNLPIKVHRQQGKDELGREGTSVEIWIDGKKFRTIFTPGARETPDQAPDGHANWSTMGGPSSDPIGSETPMADDAPATQQEIDDGLALLATLESESATISAGADDDLGYCHTVLNSCWETEDVQPLSISYSFGGPSAQIEPEYGPCANSTECGTLVAPVGVAYTLVAGAVVAGAILFSAPVVTGVAIAAWAFPSLALYIGFAGAAYNLHHCIYGT